MKALPVWLCGLLLLLAGEARADESFQMTVVSTLRHDRLEVSVGMSLEMASMLAEDPTNPEAPRLDAGNFEARREQIERQAMGLYEVSAGGTVLVPQRATASLLPAGTVQCVLLYPAPTAWPLRFHARPRSNLPPATTAALEVRDQDERSLGRKVLSPRDPANAELTVTPELTATATPPTAAFTPAPMPSRVVSTSISKTGDLPEFGVVLAVGVGLAALTAWLVMVLLRRSRR